MAELSKEEQNNGLPDRPQPSRLGLWLGILAIIIALALGGLVFYLDLQHQGQQKSLSEQVKAELDQKDQQIMEFTQQISGYQTQIAAIQSQLANVQQDSSGKDNHFNQVLDDFTKLHTEKLDITRNELKSSIEQVQRVLGKTRSDWLIADAEYLLSIANERLQLMGDVTTAKQALEAADARLRESEDAGIYKVREQLNKEIAELTKVTALDVVGMYSKIGALQQSVDKLTIFLPYAGKEKEVVAEEEANVPAELAHSWLGEKLKDLKAYVSVRHSSKPVSGIISKEEAQFSYQQLSVRLEMVKVALLQQNEPMYQAALADVQQWLNDNFTMNTIATDFLQQIEQLQAVKIKSHLPNIGESAKMLKDITKARIETDKILPANLSKVTNAEEAKPNTPLVAPKTAEAVAAPTPTPTPVPVTTPPVVNAEPTPVPELVGPVEPPAAPAPTKP